MGINERGEFIRENEAPGIEESSERNKLIDEANELAERQDGEPDSDAKISAKKKAEMKRRLLGE